MEPYDIVVMAESAEKLQNMQYAEGKQRNGSLISSMLGKVK